MNIQTEIKSLLNMEYIKLDRNKSPLNPFRLNFPYLFVTVFLEGIGRKKR